MLEHSPAQKLAALRMGVHATSGNIAGLASREGIDTTTVGSSRDGTTAVSVLNLMLLM